MEGGGEGKAGQTGNVAGPVKRHRLGSTASNFRIHVLFVIRLTDKQRFGLHNEHICISV